MISWWIFCSSKSQQQNKPQEQKTEPLSVDFVLVYDRNSVTESSHRQIDTFAFNLEQQGFQLENVPFSLNDDINFIKIHVPLPVLLRFAKLFAIELAFLNDDLKPFFDRPFRFMATPLTAPSFHDSIYHRTTRSFTRGPETVTTAEKGLIIHKVLSKNPYGPDKGEYGVQKLIKKNILAAAFPLHDGPFEWSEEGILNERQLLSRYWSNIRYWYKEQPLDLIEKYYGPETAFYFAWLGFYIKMLIPASIIGFVFFVVGAASLSSSFTVRSKEVCESKQFLCPRCIVKNCKYEPLRNSCFHSHLIHLFDNPLVIFFAGLMSVWATVFLELWRRKETMLQLRWNLRAVEIDYSMRPEFEDVKYRKLGEPYIPTKILCYRYVITGTSILFLIMLMGLAILGVMIYVKTISVVLTVTVTDKLITQSVGLIASSTGSVISVSFMMAFEMVYERVAIWLTQMENPRTQIDFDNSFTFKCYALAFINYYAVIFYIAFMKARFYTYPGDEKLWTTLGGIPSDLCNAAGCIVELGIQIIIILLAKNLVMTAKQYVLPQVLLSFNKLWTKKKKNLELTEQWEHDYMLNPMDKYHFMREYMQMIIQYGFVTFFVAAFPPAPLLALFNNLIELRVDAYKITRAYQRPVAFKVANLAAWNGILQGVTYIGVATNAFVIAFTSELIERAVYRGGSASGLQGFINSTLSIYNVSEFSMTYQAPVNISVCFYPGMRYPPNHPQKYQLTDEYWYILTMKFLAVVVFEHVVMLVTGIIAYAIPDLPSSVKEVINHQREMSREAKMKMLRDTFWQEPEVLF